MPEWRNIPGFHKAYQVSDDGRVRSVPRIRNTGNGTRRIPGKILSPGIKGKGYKGVQLASPERTVSKYVHILVAEAFIPNPENKPQVNHKDGNKRNCHKDNLEWATNKENGIHAMENGLLNHGSDRPNAKLTEEDIPFIRRRIKRGETMKVIAEDVGVSPNGISLIKRNKTWRLA